MPANPIRSILHLGVAAIAIYLAIPAYAASFDCGLARSRMEKAICSDPKVSRADETMAAAYWRARQAVSAPRRVTFLRDQRKFVSEVSGMCLNELKGAGKTPYPICLARRLSYRAVILEASVPRMPRYTYAYDLRSRQRTMKKRSDDFNPNIPFLDESIVTVRIVRPIDAAARRFNAAMRQEAKLRASVLVGAGGKDPFAERDRQGTISANQWLVASSEDVASVYTGAGAYTGGNHPYYRGTTAHWSFRLNRFLRDDEVFRQVNDPKLVTLVRARLRNSEGKRPEGCTAYLTSVPLNGFTIHREGMTFWFDSRLCESSAKLSWAELTPFRRANRPFDPAKLRTNPHGNQAWANIEPISQSARH